MSARTQLRELGPLTVSPLSLFLARPSSALHGSSLGSALFLHHGNNQRSLLTPLIPFQLEHPTHTKQFPILISYYYPCSTRPSYTHTYPSTYTHNQAQICATAKQLQTQYEILPTLTPLSGCYCRICCSNTKLYYAD